MTLLCRSSEVNQETYHAMPPCSTNHSVTQLFIKSVPPILKPGAHNQMLVPHQSTDETTCSPPGNKTWKETDEGNKELNVATAASKSGICYRIFVCYRRAEIDMERGWERKKRGRESSVDMPAVCWFISLFHQLCSHSPNNRRTAFRWTKAAAKSSNTLTRHQHEHLTSKGRIAFPSAFTNCLVPQWSDCLQNSRLIKLHTWYSEHASYLSLNTASPYTPSSLLRSFSFFINFFTPSSCTPFSLPLSLALSLHLLRLFSLHLHHCSFAYEAQGHQKDPLS